MPSHPSQSEPQRFVTGVTLPRRAGDGARGYPYSIPAIAQLETLILTTSVTFFVGENGSGKSTLVEAPPFAFPAPLELINEGCTER
jgi:predicted ATPase